MESAARSLPEHDESAEALGYAEASPAAEPHAPGPAPASPAAEPHAPGLAPAPPAPGPAPPALPDLSAFAAASDELVEEGAPAWVMTFGDLMSLLLTFFILLFSMSNVETEKFRLAAESLREAFGDMEGQRLPDSSSPPASDSIPTLSQNEQVVESVLDQIQEQLQRFVSENSLQDEVAVMREPEGVFLRMQDAALFEAGAAGVEGARAATLERLGDITRLIEVPVVVTGHTDDTPIRSPVFRSNWELSAARAAGVARALVERGQDPRLVTVESYGEHRPITANDTPEGRAQNRRVELYYSRQGIMSTLIERGLILDPATVTGSPETPPGAAGEARSAAEDETPPADGG